LSPRNSPKHELVGWLEFNVPFQHKYGYISYIRDELEQESCPSCCISTAYPRGNERPLSIGPANDAAIGTVASSDVPVFK